MGLAAAPLVEGFSTCVASGVRYIGRWRHSCLPLRRPSVAPCL
jgi:hypothetical protein